MLKFIVKVINKRINKNKTVKQMIKNISTKLDRNKMIIEYLIYFNKMS